MHARSLIGCRKLLDRRINKAVESLFVGSQHSYTTSPCSTDFYTKLPKKCGIGIIGLGQVGSAVAKNLASGGYNVKAVLDTNANQLTDLPGNPIICESPGQLGDICDVAVTCLPKPENVAQVLLGVGGCEDGLLDALTGGKVWIDHSTTDYHQTLDLAKQVESKGAHVLEAPVTGGMALLKQGKMTMLVGGQRHVFDWCKPILDRSSANVLYMGKMGSATITKVVSNMLAATHLVAAGEALMIARRSGVDLDSFFKGIRLSAGNSYVFETEAPLIMNGTFEPDFAIDLHCKDLNLGYQISKECGASIPLHALVEQIYSLAMHHYGGSVGSSHPAKLYQDLLKTSFHQKGYDDWTYSIEQVEGGSIGVVHKKK